MSWCGLEYQFSSCHLQRPWKNNGIHWSKLERTEGRGCAQAPVLQAAPSRQGSRRGWPWRQSLLGRRSRDYFVRDHSLETPFMQRWGGPLWEFIMVNLPTFVILNYSQNDHLSFPDKRQDDLIFSLFETFLFQLLNIYAVLTEIYAGLVFQIWCFLDSKKAYFFLLLLHKCPKVQKANLYLALTCYILVYTNNSRIVIIK